MYELPRFSNDLCAVLVRSKHGHAKIIEQARRLSAGQEFVVVLNPLEGIENRLVPAYMGAAIRQAEGSMHSSSLSMEIILFVAGTMNISNALEDTVAKGDQFVLFASRTSIVNYLLSRFGLEVIKKYELRIDSNGSGEVAITAIKDDK